MECRSLTFDEPALIADLAEKPRDVDVAVGLATATPVGLSSPVGDGRTLPVAGSTQDTAVGARSSGPPGPWQACDVEQAAWADLRCRWARADGASCRRCSGAGGSLLRRQRYLSLTG